MPKSITVRTQPVLVEQLLAKEFGPVTGRALLARTMELNPGLAEAGLVIPIGRTVIVPDPPAPTPAQPRRVVDLFGG